MGKGDFDADGHPDVVATIDERVICVLGDGGGGYEGPTISAVGAPDLESRIAHFEMGDFDRDGMQDIVALVEGTSGSDSIAWFRGRGRGQFDPEATLVEFDSIDSMQSGDLDGDEHLDFVVFAGAPELLVYEEGGGSLVLRQSLAVPASGRAKIVDFDFDGRMDVAFAGGDKVFVYCGTESGLEWCQEIPLVAFASEAVFGDFREDQQMDFIASMRPCPAPCAFRSYYHEAPSYERSLLVNEFPIEVGDFEGDGHLDVFSARVWSGDGAGNFEFVDGSGLFESVQGRAVDLDDEGSDELVALYRSDVRVARSRRFGSPQLEESRFTCGGMDGYVEGDADGDGYADLVAFEDGMILAMLNRTFGVPCGAGTVNDAVDGPVPVLFLNGESGEEGGPERLVSVSGDEPIDVSIALPPSGGGGRFVVHADFGRFSDRSVERMPKGIGFTCRPFLVPLGAMPAAIWNNTTRPDLVGSSRGFDGNPISDPSPAPTVFVSLPAGIGETVPIGATLIWQGIVVDPGSTSPKNASVTNAISLTVVE